MPNAVTQNTQLPNSAISNNPLLSITQEVLSGLGFKDQSNDMLEAEQADNSSKQQLIKAIQNYSENPDQHHITQLISILDKELEKTTKEYNLAKNKQIKYQKETQNETKASQKQSYGYQFLNWIYKGSKQFFGSDNANLANHYEEIAKNRKKLQNKLKEYRNSLAEKNVKTQNDNPVKIPSQFPASFSLSNLNGRNGVKFTGSAESLSGAGDVDGDGLQDFIAGSPSNNNFYGEIYLVFGKKETWPSQFELADLNGMNGVKFHGEHVGDNCGGAVSSAGDVNLDGYSDLLIGASNTNNIGVTYLIYGYAKPWLNPFPLASLNGTNGVKFTSSQSGSYLGYAVSQAGDINGDGIPDFLIGALLANNNAGITYLVFGQKEGWSSPFNLDSLDGTNGVKFTGESPNDRSGGSVSSAGDVNGDGIDDLLIGAPFATNGALTGTSYLVFGHSGTWSSTFSLSSFNGYNGAKFWGPHPNTLSGFAISGAGDINKDGFGDLIIGAPYDFGYNGATYVIFGHSGYWPVPINLVLYVNGNNGFKVTGELADDESGYSVSATDFDGNGDSDVLIGATLANSYTGSAYVILGQKEGWSPLFPLGKLNGLNGMEFLGEMPNDGCGMTISDVGDTNGDSIRDFIIGSPFFNATARSYLIFGNSGYMNKPDPIIISQGGSYLLNNISLSASFSGSGPERMQFIVTNILHGHFEFIYQPKFPISTFTQLQVNSNQVRFVHDGSCMVPSYKISSNGGRLAFTPPTNVDINFIPILPNITINTLILNEGLPLILSSQMLNTVDPGDVVSNLLYTVTEIQHGQFALVTAPNLPITQFTQQQINLGQILFIPDNSGLVPSYTLLVQNSCELISNPSTATIQLRRVPVLGNNQLTLTQGQTITLLLSNLNGTNVNDQSLNALLQFIVSEVQHGHFEALNNLGTVINAFFQQNISDGIIRFIHDGRIDAPSYSVAVSDGTLTSLPHPVLINFNLENDASNDSGNLLKSILTWLLSVGTILGISTFFIRRYFTNRNEEYFILKKDPILKDVVIPIFNAVAEKIKCSGFLSYMSDETKDNYISAIREIINQLDMHLERDNMSKRVEKIMKDNTEAERLKTGIASNARFLLKDQFYNCCSCGSKCSLCSSCSRRFFAETSPTQLTKNAGRIARAVKSNLYSDAEDHFPSSNSNEDSSSVGINDSAAIILSGSTSLHRPLLDMSNNRGAVNATVFDNVNISTRAFEKTQADNKESFPPSSPLTPSWTAQRNRISDSGSATIVLLPPQTQTSESPHADLKHSK